MKKPTNIIVIACAAIIGVVVAIAAYSGASAYLGKKTSQGDHACGSGQRIYTVVINDSKVAPSNTDARHCDQLTIVNQDDTLRLVSFGQHNHHMQYDGVTEKRLEKGQSFTVTLESTGSFRFHDHLHNEVGGTFSVRP